MHVMFKYVSIQTPETTLKNSGYHDIPADFAAFCVILFYLCLHTCPICSTHSTFNYSYIGFQFLVIQKLQQCVLLSDLQLYMVTVAIYSWN